MYIPPQFAELRIEVIHDLIRAHPLATLVTLSEAGINANPIPLHLSLSSAPYGILCGHVARANPLLADIANGHEALAIFHGPDTYISPSWYSSKAATGKVVPTWNYVVAHAYGYLRIVDDRAWLFERLDTFTAQHEAALPHPWSIADAPREFIDKLLDAIVGIEMVITRLSGKWKVRQNQSPENQASVLENLRNSGTSDAAAMALWLESFLAKPNSSSSG